MSHCRVITLKQYLYCHTVGVHSFHVRHTLVSTFLSIQPWRSYGYATSADMRSMSLAVHVLKVSNSMVESQQKNVYNYFKCIFINILLFGTADILRSAKELRTNKHVKSHLNLLAKLLCLKY